MEAWRGERPREETDRRAGPNSLGLPTQITVAGIRRLPIWGDFFADAPADVHPVAVLSPHDHLGPPRLECPTSALRIQPNFLTSYGEAR